MGIGWQFLLGAALIVFGFMLLALVDAPRRALRRFGHVGARPRPSGQVSIGTDEMPPDPGPEVPQLSGLWAIDPPVGLWATPPRDTE